MRTLIAYLLLVSTLVFVSCSKKEDAKPTPSPSLENASLSLASSTEVVEGPASMKSSNDQQAQMATSLITSVNGITNYLTYLKAPSNATKSSTRIVAANARINAAGDVLVYTWKDGNGNSIGYQISETVDSYVFEIFLKSTGKTDWLKYFHAEEKKDKSAGSMTILDIFGILGSNLSAKLIDYTWARSGDMLTFTMTDYDGAFVANLVINEKTKAGNVVYLFDGVKEYEITWTATGSGTWTYYDTDGSVSDSGSWTV